ncbi:thioesterase domain-containing protein [Dictyobacter kobayashii]|uniref:Uncharacterized protein n=1 Tax=Dictyobacter kobayashii TaxID=2014872 RepID=A0A402AP80_9CHLR|nr:hypothetical protein [Dictyobacter kobayashii]GCE20973.1 hypothetical protein KDK_47730 [Dictyobacter kobayashii]
MSNTPDISEARRALLEKYLSGKVQPPEQPIPVPPTEASRERAVAVQARGTKSPFFYLHGDWKGQAFYCFPLARGLGDDQPFYILEPYDFDGLPGPPPFEEVAAAHVKSMRAIQPTGPYFLGDGVMED